MSAIKSLSSSNNAPSLHKTTRYYDLCQLIEKGKFKEFKKTLTKDEASNCKSQAGQSLLRIAAIYQKRCFIELLLDLGANPNGSPDDRVAPINSLVMSRKKDLVTLLLNRGASPSGNRDVFQDPYNPNSPLSYAVCFIDIDLIQMLLVKGADINNDRIQFIM